MNVPAILLFAVGGAFAVAYGLFITVGWAITRRNRMSFQEETGVDYLPVFDLSSNTVDVAKGKVRTIRTDANNFLTAPGKKINHADFKLYIAEGHSEKYPSIKSGDLIFVDGYGEVKYAFEVPDLSDYR